MKIILLFTFLIIQEEILAQEDIWANLEDYLYSIKYPSKEEIRKFKINKITIKYSVHNNKVEEFYFDKKGNDTALCVDGVLSRTRKYEKDKQGKIVKWIQYNSTGIKKFTAKYVYGNDSFYNINYYAEKYQNIINTEVYDKTGKIQTEYLMDGGQHIYKYDSLGRLLRIDSKPGLDGYDQFTADYTYDNNKPLGSLKTIYTIYAPLLYKSAQEFFYNSEGLLLKTVETITFDWDTKKDISTTVYSYVFRK